MPLMLILPVLLFNMLVDWYVCRAVWRRCMVHAKFWKQFFLWSSVLLTCALILIIAWPKSRTGDAQLDVVMWGIFAYFSCYVPKYIFIVVDLLGKLPQLFKHKKIKGFTTAGIVLGAMSFVLMWWGALVTRNSVQVNNVEIVDASVPAAFDGFKIAQISDLHTGTFGSDTTFVAKLVAEINDQNPDIVLFTGDIVNRHTSELLPYASVLSRIKAPVYSVLGNHDYGDYFQWKSPLDKQQNMELMYDLQRRMGWQLLNNDSRTIYAGGDSIVVIGVENIGEPPFPVYGDLDKAYPTIGDEVFKVLMSHNPAHWLDDIADSPDKNIALTLSGHTHAMQMIFFGWSPAEFRYKTWGGLYSDDDNHKLYVNIGSGEIGFPARLGSAAPEITLLTLKTK